MQIKVIEYESHAVAVQRLLNVNYGWWRVDATVLDEGQNSDFPFGNVILTKVSHTSTMRYVPENRIETRTID